MSKICKVEGCETLVGKHGAKGMCPVHYYRWHKHGNPYMVLRNYSGLKKKYPDEYRIWSKMKLRCYNKNIPEYKYYGGRGIKVCDRWLVFDGFENFVKDMGPRPNGKYPSGLPLYSIDRIDVNGDYTPENCRWATAKEQANNRRTVSIPSRRKDNIIVEWNGETHYLKEWSRIVDIKYNTLYMRYRKYGWRGDKLFSPSNR